MKKVFILIAIAGFTLTSCTTSKSVYNTESEVAGYTLKNKKEQMQQKITHKKSKTVLTTP